jgi:hypothetical protein
VTGDRNAGKAICHTEHVLKCPTHCAHTCAAAEQQRAVNIEKN